MTADLGFSGDFLFSRELECCCRLDDWYRPANAIPAHDLNPLHVAEEPGLELPTDFPSSEANTFPIIY